ncbi:hypothetical protein ACIOD2_16755 [Amycolatopsis sp. NPDC088138]|uniref:hypothetical protein n=1 Tax=Amycolatopsis sp. NPDC088138 TaxID=3363938 RepID=UPI0038024FC9
MIPVLAPVRCDRREHVLRSKLLQSFSDILDGPRRNIEEGRVLVKKILRVALVLPFLAALTVFAGASPASAGTLNCHVNWNSSIKSCLQLEMAPDGHTLRAINVTQVNDSGCDTPSVEHDGVNRGYDRICTQKQTLQYGDRQSAWIGVSYPSGAEFCLTWETLNPPNTSPTVPKTCATVN